MSPPDLTDRPRGIVVQKPRSDIYTALLAVGLTALILGIVMLVLEMNKFDWDIKASKVPRTAAAEQSIAWLERA